MVAHLTVLLVFLQFCLIDGYISESGGGLIVTLGVFSGRPDPTWSVAAKDPNYKTIVDRLAEARKAGVVYNLEAAPERLGYKGFAVQEGKTKPRLIVGVNTVQLQQLLLKTIPKKLISDGALKIIQKEISSGAVKVNPRKYKRNAPSYNPAAWDVPNYDALWCNNCYNYALDRKDNNAAQPGGQAVDEQLLTGPYLQGKAEQDGLVVHTGAPTVPPGNRHLVALFVWPGNDYHWYRLDGNNQGRWSHKRGLWIPASDEDSSNPPKKITDPKEARSPPGYDYQFVAFMTVDKNTVNVAGPPFNCARILRNMGVMLDQNSNRTI